MMNRFIGSLIQALEHGNHLVLVSLLLVLVAGSLCLAKFAMRGYIHRDTRSGKRPTEAPKASVRQ